MRVFMNAVPEKKKNLSLFLIVNLFPKSPYPKTKTIEQTKTTVFTWESRNRGVRRRTAFSEPVLIFVIPLHNAAESAVLLQDSGVVKP